MAVLVHVLLCCRQGMRADFVVLDGNMLDVLKDGSSHIPAIQATYVNGVCVYGCSTSVEYQ